MAAPQGVPIAAMTANTNKDHAPVVPSRPKTEQVKFRWPPELIQEIRDVARRSGRTINDAGELLMRFALDADRAAKNPGSH